MRVEASRRVSSSFVLVALACVLAEEESCTADMDVVYINLEHRSDRRAAIEDDACITRLRRQAGCVT